MKRIVLTLFAACALLASCVDYQSQIEELQGKIDKMTENIASLEAITSTLGDLRNLLAVYQAGDAVTGINPVDGGYEFSFKNNGVVKVGGKTPNISASLFEGKFYWTLNGEWLTDGSGNKVEVTKAPDFRINDGSIELSVDGKATWIKLEVLDTPLITSINEDADFYHVTIAGGVSLSIPKYSEIVPLQVAFSGDGSTMASTGKAVVDYFITGISEGYSIAPVVGEGWTSTVMAETATKGQIEFNAPAPVADAEATVFVSDGLGHMVTTKLDFASLTVSEDFPVMYPAWEAFSIGAEGGQLNVSVFTNLEYEVKIEGGDWLSLVGTKALREDIVTFSAQTNDQSEIRFVDVTLSADIYTRHIVIYQEAFKSISGENLSANGTANCYIVTKEGDYYFTADVAGNGDAGLFAYSEGNPVANFPTTSKLEPVKIENLLNIGDVISDVRFEDGKIYFHATGAKGNATIGVKNSRNFVIWSWHIWCTDMPKDRTYTNPDKLQFTVLDRNIGATSADPADGEATYGMYYQWGRKDPFTYDMAATQMTTNTAHNFVFGTRYPMRPYSEDGNASSNWYNDTNDHLWGNPYYTKNVSLTNLHKSIYDPCPVGYMVPPANTFLIFGDLSRCEYVDSGIIVHGDYGQTNFFPYAGRAYRSSSTRNSEVALWHSCAARCGIYDNGGGACTRVDKGNDHKIYWYYGDFRARAIPVRCVKQVSAE